MDPIAEQRTQKTVVKSSTLYWQTDKRFRNQQTGIRRAEAKFLVRDGRLGRITRRKKKQGIRDRRGWYWEGRQENAGKTCMAKNNLVKD